MGCDVNANDGRAVAACEVESSRRDGENDDGNEAADGIIELDGMDEA